MNHKEVYIQPGNTKPLQVGDKVFKSIHDWELSEKDLEKASRELGETEEKKERCLQKLKKKLSEDTNHKYRLDDAYLLRYLRARKYDVSKAYQSLKLFYDLRKKHPEPLEVSTKWTSAQKLNFFTNSLYTDEEGRILFFMDLDKWNPDETSMLEIAAACFNVCDVSLMNPKCQINGIVVIYDVKSLKMKHISELICSGWLFTGLYFVQTGYPSRISKVILLNVNRSVQFVLKLLKPLLKRKIAERIVVLGSDVNEIHQHVNPVLLPKKLNGTLEDEEYDTSQHVFNNLEYIKYERSFNYL